MKDFFSFFFCRSMDPISQAQITEKNPVFCYCTGSRHCRKSNVRGLFLCLVSYLVTFGITHSIPLVQLVNLTPTSQWLNEWAFKMS